jgi:Peptidase inhibitor family I36
MKLPFFGRRAAAILAAAALPLTATVSAAQAASGPHSGAAARTAVSVKGGVTPDFTCPSPDICLFPNKDFTGNYNAWDGPAVLPTDVYNGRWISFDSIGASNPHPGSINNTSQSVMWVYAKDNGDRQCLDHGKWIPAHTYGWFFIQFGIHTCGSIPTPLP